MGNLRTKIDKRSSNRKALTNFNLKHRWRLLTALVVAILGLNLLTGLLYVAPAYAAPKVGENKPPITFGPQLIQQDARLFAAGQVSSIFNTALDSMAVKLGTEGYRPPSWSGDWAAFGMFSSEAIRLQEPFNTLLAEWQADLPEGTKLELDLRASPDGQNWTLWEVLEQNRQSASFDAGRAYLYAQYRVRLFSRDTNISPAFKAVRLEANRRDLNNLMRPNSLNIMANADNTPPTYKVHATREGLVGWTTANGHKIQPDDRFVSLPSWTALNDKGKNDYRVRITAPNGKSAVAPVWDTGPWNFKDNYWHSPRYEFKDLPVGVPQAEKAFYEKHNGGKNENGAGVYNPSGIDIGDGTYWYDLGLAGAQTQSKLDVTFIWEGSVPAPATISGTTANNVGSGTASISWNTNLATNSWVEYGFDAGYGFFTAIDNTMTTSHKVNLPDLVPNKTYHFRVRGRDIYGTEAVSADATFVTQPGATTAFSAWTNDPGIGVTISPKFDAITIAGGRANKSYWSDNPKQDYNAGASTLPGNVAVSGALDVDLVPNCDEKGQNCAFGFGTGYKAYLQFVNGGGEVLQIGLIHDQTLSPGGVTLMVEGTLGGKPFARYFPPDSINAATSHHLHAVWFGGQIYLTFDFNAHLQYTFGNEGIDITFVGAGRAKDDVIAVNFRNIGFSLGSVVTPS